MASLAIPTRKLSDVLLDVRKAYRLIFLYQRRVLDLCDEIKEAFPKNLLPYFWTASHIGVSPARGPLFRVPNAWAFLPLYDFCAFYLPEGVHNEELKPGDWMLTVRVSADSGCPDPFPGEPDPTQFTDLASCESSVRLYVYYSSQKLKANWYYGVFDNNKWPRDDGLGNLDRGIRTFGMKFPLSRMSTAEGVLECVQEFSTDMCAALSLAPDRSTS